MGFARNEAQEEPNPDDMYEFGTLAEVVQMLKMPDGNLRVVVEGRERVAVRHFDDTQPFLLAGVEVVEGGVVRATIGEKLAESVA